MDPGSLAEYFRTRRPADVLVTDSAGSRVWFHAPLLEADTLRGIQRGSLPRVTLAIPLGRVQGVSVPRFSSARTLGLSVAVLAAVGVVIVELAGGSRNQPLY